MPTEEQVNLLVAYRSAFLPERCSLLTVSDDRVLVKEGIRVDESLFREEVERLKEDYRMTGTAKPVIVFAVLSLASVVAAAVYSLYFLFGILVAFFLFSMLNEKHKRSCEEYLERLEKQFNERASPSEKDGDYITGSDGDIPEAGACS